ncbi:hypothetical protein B0H67DRAFT_658473 [Lasiosphaeris hirsuta]|uniref:DUF7779 domain-containing protein n=1 Tax=Lasiosphaeris hirsuta TaxID=260670 RepID=A0AA40B077_9PEZI|nr:hypothetical protein B0H67DRAFT_658473 [Lasiosphaeris hirsuta]
MADANNIDAQRAIKLVGLDINGGRSPAKDITLGCGGQVPISYTIVLAKPHFAVPHTRDNRFQGREVEFSELHRTLTEPGSASQRNLKVAAIQFRSAYAVVFWLKAESPVILQQEYHCQVVKYWQTANGSGAIAAETDLKKLVQAANNWLSTTADSLSTKQLRLEGFDDDQASSLLQSQIGLNEPSSDTSLKIVHELDGLPLALCQMCSYIRQTRCTLSEFYSLLCERMNSRRLYSDTMSASSLQYADTLASCCELSFNRLSKSYRHLLNVLAFFQTDGVDERVVTEGCAKISRLGHLADPLEWNNAVRILTKYDLVSRSANPGDLAGRQLIRMHRVVKLHALHTLDDASNPWAEALEDAVGLLTQLFPRRPDDGGTMFKHWTACAKWLPHVLSIKEEFDRGIGNPMSFAQKALEVCDLVLDPDDPDPIRADTATIIGALQLHVFSTCKECLAMFQKALDLRSKWLDVVPKPGKNDFLQLANAYNNTGAAHLVLEEHDNALPLFQKALDIKSGSATNNICRVEMGQKRISQALENCRRAVELVEKANGRDDFRSNQFRFTLADLLIACGDMKAGPRVHEDTLTIREKVMGSQNNDTGVSYYGLACVKAVDNAIEAFQNYEDSDDRLARCFFRKSLILQSPRQETEAEEALEAAQELMAKVLGVASDLFNVSLTMHGEQLG